MDQKFFHEVNKVEEMLHAMDSSVRAISKLQKRASQAVHQQEENRITTRMNQMTQETNQIASQIRNRLHRLKDSVDPRAHNHQMFQNQCDNLARRFMESLQRYQEIQMHFQKEQQDKIRRQYLIANPRATEEEIQRAIDETDSSPVFSQALMRNARSQDAKRMYNDVEERHRQVVNLARSIEQLHAMFLDMQTMIETQDHLVLHVSDNVKESRQATENAAQEMTEAVQHQKQARKKCAILTVCIIILLIVVVLIVLLYPFPGGSILEKAISAGKNGENKEVAAPPPSPASRTVSTRNK